MINMINTAMLMLSGSEGGLEIKLLEIVIHVLNLIILILFLKTLVYKPTLNFINNRRRNIQEQLDEGNRLSEEAEVIKGQSKEIISQARQNAEFIALEATKEAERKSKTILAEAKEKSIVLIERTKKDMQSEKLRLEQEVKQEVVDLAITMSAKILEREVTASDNDKIIKECLNGWEK